MRRWKVALIAVLALALGFGLGTLRPIVERPPLVVGQDAVTDAASASVVVRTENVGGTVLHILPTGERRVALILYPGGLVRPQAGDGVPSVSRADAEAAILAAASGYLDAVR